MIVSWLLALGYTAVYTVIILLIKYRSEKAVEESLGGNESMNKSKKYKSEIKSSLLGQQQEFKPNVDKISENSEVPPEDITNKKIPSPSKNNNNNNNDKDTVTTVEKKTDNDNEDDNEDDDDDDLDLELGLQRRNSESQHSQTMDLDELHALEHTSNPIGASVSIWEACVAIIHSLDSGLHLGLIVDMINNSHHWNLVEQYTFVSLFILCFYRVISWFVISFYLPRYALTKKESSMSSKRAKDHLETQRRLSQQSHRSSIDKTNNNNNNNDSNNSLQKTKQETKSSILESKSSSSSHHKHNKIRTFLSYSWLQFLFDFGYVIELAPWLWNWAHTKVVVPEFAWFCKIRSLLESFPFAVLTGTYMLSISGDYQLTSSLHIYALVSFSVSIITILMSVLLYDRLTLNREEEEEFKIVYLFNLFHRLFFILSRTIILSFLLALFPIYVLPLVVSIPIVSYSGQYSLAQFDAEPFNVIYKAFIAFPDYSTPCGRIEPTQNYTNKLNKCHVILVFIFGFPIIFIITFAQWLIDKILKINKKTIFDDKEVYASYSILSYVSGRLLESILELIFIGIEIYGSKDIHTTEFVDMSSNMPHILYWLSIISTILYCILFKKLYLQFVCDNEEDYDLSQAASDPLKKRASIVLGGGLTSDKLTNPSLSNTNSINNNNNKQSSSADYIVSNDQYNKSHINEMGIGLGLNINNYSQHSHNSSIDSLATLGHSRGFSSDFLFDIRGSRQQLRKKQYWIAIHQNNYMELSWLLRSRQHIDLLEFNEREQLGIVILGIRHDWKCLKLLIDNGGGVRQLAHYASYHGYIKILSFLHFEMKIDITELEDQFNELLVFSAIEGNQPNVIKLLADLGANLSLPTTRGESTAIMAASKGFLDTLKILVESGIDLTVTDDHGNTIAHHAALAYNGYLIFEYLNELDDKIIMRQSSMAILSASSIGNNNNSNNNNNPNNNNINDTKMSISQTIPALSTPRESAIDRDILNAAASSNNINNNNNNNIDNISGISSTSLSHAPSKQAKIFDIGFDFNRQNKKGATPSYNASWSGQYKNLEILASIGADLELPNYEGNSPLIAAAMNEQPMIIGQLLKYGCDINCVNNNHETALFWASTQGNIGSVEVLISNKANLEIHDKHGNTPLISASIHGENKALKLLIAAGSNVNTVNNEGFTALIKIISSEEHVYYECINELIDSKKCDWKIMDDEGNNALLWSCMVGEMKVFETLVKKCQITKDYLLEYKNQDNETCIDWIAQNRDVCIDGVRLLESMGIDMHDEYESDDQDDDDDEDEEDDETNDDDDDDVVDNA